ncbi:Gti1/Pac2 family-domain-containing protein, partial [Limtongia smithiae]|uniref:Gti1/Pac2 family-domain-containing protein n=1 Tax=Limtongia smithiae TaxID=1125753 RepID=UPI0034CF22A4
LAATYSGYVSTTHDALILFQACMQGLLHYVSRRLHDRERSELIRSGNIFIFNEGTSGIKRWTDGIAWSPSRILGNFLVYRQLEKPFAPGEKKRAAKRNRRKKRAEPYTTTPAGGSGSGHIAAGLYDPDAERALVGSLVDSYGFKDGGLMKKTMSVLINGSPHHLVSYYKPEDVVQGNFSTPSTNPLLRDLPISPELTQRQNFRIPPDGSNSLERAMYGPPQGPGPYGWAPQYQPPPQSLPQPPPQQQPPQQQQQQQQQQSQPQQQVQPPAPSQQAQQQPQPPPQQMPLP